MDWHQNLVYECREGENEGEGRRGRRLVRAKALSTVINQDIIVFVINSICMSLTKLQIF